jgi:hypothetical protein
LVILVIVLAHNYVDKRDHDQNDKTDKQCRGVNQECRHKTSDPRAVKKALRQGNSMKGDFIETPYVSFTSAEGNS